MRKQTNIKIKTKDYSVEFNYGSFRLLTEALNLKSFGEVQQKMVGLEFEKITTDLSFEQYDFLGIVLLSGVQGCSKNEKVKLTAEECTEVLFGNIPKLTEIMNLFSSAVTKRLGKNPQANPRKR